MKMRMNKMIITLAATLSVVAVLCACDDTITKITNPDVQTVATYKDLAKCSGKNEGELYFVKDSGAVYLCSERAWKKTGASSANESESKNGTDSKNGRSCTVSALKDGAGYDIICAGKKIGTILNGVDAAALQNLAVTAGMSTLYEDGLQKVAAGLTSLEELLRVAHA